MDNALWKYLSDELKKRGYRPKHHQVSWDGRQLARSRETAKHRVGAEIRLARSALKVPAGAPVVLVGHSHGGSVAESFMRSLDDRGRRDYQVRGAVCLGTPFLHSAPRGNRSGVLLWCLSMLLGLMLLLWNGVQEIPLWKGLLSGLLSSALLTPLLGAGVVFALAYLVLGWFDDRSQDSGESSSELPVFAYSFSDDEVNMLLSFVESVANVPQLVLHSVPACVAFAVTALVTLLQIALGVSWPTATVYFLWGLASVPLLAILLGSLASALVAFSFGEPITAYPLLLTRRLIVSFAPLRSRNVRIRFAPRDQFSWRLTLRHSAIYQEKSAFPEIVRFFDLLDLSTVKSP